MLPDCSEFQSQHVHKYRYFFHDTSGQNLGPTSKAQWFLLNELCTDTQLQASYGEDNFRKVNGSWMGKGFKLGMLVCSSTTRIILIGIHG